MGEDGCGFSGVWNIYSDISLKDVVVSVYHLDYLQVVFFTVEGCCSTGVDWSFEQIEDL